jgi:DNA-binding NarL/FixJ family response regulator/signal transduction histidine kinase
MPLSREELAAIVQQFLEELAAGLGCACMAVLGYIPREERLAGVTMVGSCDENIRTWSLSVEAFPAVRRAFASRDPIILSEPGELPPGLAEHFDGETVLIPLILGARPLSVLVCRLRPGLSPRLTVWRERAREIAARAALVVEMQRTAAEYQEELRRRQHTRAIAASILEGQPLQEIADLITRTVAERLNIDRVGIYRRDPGGKVFPISLRNISPEYGNRVSRLAYPTPIITRATATGLPIYLRDVQNDPQIGPEQRALFRQENITSIVMAVLQYGPDTYGALAIYPEGERQFTPLEMSAVQGFADMATLGIAISQQLKQQRELAVMEERNRLQREIHDTVAQSLAALVLQIETAEAHLEAQDPAAAHEMLSAARTQAQRALQETRRAVQGLAPAALDTLSLSEAISRELEELEAQTGVQTQFISPGDAQPLTADQSMTLLRIAQEAINNARKHSGARRIRAGLQYGPEEVTLLIEDDGAGFDAGTPRTPGPEGGYGLFGMNERARLMGGSLKIDSTPGWGTRVSTTLPYVPVALPPAVTQQLVEAPAVSTATVRAVPPTAAELPTEEPYADALRVLVVDDHQMARQGIRAMLEQSGEVIVVGEAENGGQVLEAARRLSPDVVLMDLQMPGVDGLEGLRRIRAERPELPVVILTTFQTDETLAEALQAGARGFLLKDVEPVDLLAAIRAAHRGESLLSSSATARLVALASGQTTRSASSELNERELEILELLARGTRNKEIASALFIAPKTVEYHLSSLFAKLGVSNRTEAARVAIERRLVTPEYTGL